MSHHDDTDGDIEAQCVHCGCAMLLSAAEANDSADEQMCQDCQDELER